MKNIIKYEGLGARGLGFNSRIAPFFAFLFEKRLGRCGIAHLKLKKRAKTAISHLDLKSRGWSKSK